MNKREKMMQGIEQVAAQNGHKLFPWSRGAHGFNTHCHNCGANVAITVSKNSQREGGLLTEPCKS